MPTKFGGFIGVEFKGTAILIRWWNGPPVMVLVPSTEPICIRKEKSPIRLNVKVPAGALRGFPLTQERKQFLLKQGVYPELIKKGHVFDVSDALASQFQKERDAVISLAERCGLSADDLDKIHEARKKLAEYHPTDHTGRIAKRGLQSLLSSKIRVSEAGRPKKISAEERQELREKADKLKASGQNLRDILVQFSEEYELRPSYIRRILEDRRNEKR